MQWRQSVGVFQCETRLQAFFLGHVVSIRGLFEIMAKYLYPEIVVYYKVFGDGEFLPSVKLVGKVADMICGGMQGK